MCRCALCATSPRALTPPWVLTPPWLLEPPCIPAGLCISKANTMRGHSSGTMEKGFEQQHELNLAVGISILPFESSIGSCAPSLQVAVQCNSASSSEFETLTPYTPNIIIFQTTNQHNGCAHHCPRLCKQCSKQTHYRLLQAMYAKTAMNAMHAMMLCTLCTL